MIWKSENMLNIKKRINQTYHWYVVVNKKINIYSDQLTVHNWKLKKKYIPYKQLAWNLQGINRWFKQIQRFLGVYHIDPELHMGDFPDGCLEKEKTTKCSKNGRYKILIM